MAGSICSKEFFFTQMMLQFQKEVEGFRFKPTEQELINYLKSKKPGSGEDFCIIPRLKNITDFNPWQLPAKFTEQSIIPSIDGEWWFIVPQTPNQRVRRKTPCGSSWKVTGDPRDIRSDGKIIGFKKILDFPEGKGGKSNWVIHEYHLPENSPNPSGNNVLCHLILKRDEKADTSTARSEHEAITSAVVEQLLNQSNDEPVVQEGISPTLYTFSLSHLQQLLQRDAESLSIRQSTNIGSSYVPDADLSYAKGKKGEEPRFEMVQQENGARNIEDEAAGRAKLPQRGLQSPNNSSSSPIHQFTNIRSLSDADLSDAKGKKGEEPRFEMVQQENGARNIEDEAGGRAKLLPHGLQSPNNSSSSTTHHFTNVGNSSYADLSYTKVQKGEEPRFKMVQQETGNRNIEDEAAARAKNGQTSIMENRRTKIKPLNRVDPLEEAEGILPSTCSSGFMDFSQFSSYFDKEPAAQAKGLEHEKHNLAGNSPKRRRLDVSEENQIQ